MVEVIPPVFGVALVKLKRSEGPRIRGAKHVADLIRRYIQDEDREHFVVVMLDQPGRVIGMHTVAIGSLTECLVSPREVFKVAILSNAASLVLGHNHPSGDLTPSKDDLRITDELVRAGKLLNIEVLDHVIVGGGKFVSLKGTSYGKGLP